jgi:hypothetical protein
MKLNIPKYFTLKDFRVMGIYFLIRRGKIVYIGQTKNIIGRIANHVISFDKIRIIPCSKRDLKKYEKRWIIRFKPKENTMFLYPYVGTGHRYKTPVNFTNTNLRINPELAKRVKSCAEAAKRSMNKEIELALEEKFT